MPQPSETIAVTTPTVACDGSGGALGHPRVYLTFSATGASANEITCPYCSKHYVLKGDTNSGSRAA